MKMDKKKWMLVMMLLIVLTLVCATVVEAKLGGNLGNWVRKNKGKTKFVVANAVAVFILAYFLIFVWRSDQEIPNSTIWILIVAALAVGIIFGHKDYFWKLKQLGILRDIFHVKVLVNIAVISAAAFIGLGFLKVGENEYFNSDSGKWALRVFIILVAGIIAMQPFEGGRKSWDQIKDTYPYVWERDTMIKARFFLLGDKNCYSWTGENGVISEDEVYAPDGSRYYKSKKWFGLWGDQTIRKEESRWNDNVEGAEYTNAKGLFDLTNKVRTGSRLNAGEIQTMGSLPGRAYGGGQYCYTQEKVDEAIREAKRRTGRPTRTSIRQYSPSAAEPLVGFGILRGKNLFIFKHF